LHAKKLNYGDQARLDRVLERLRAGAEIGCTGRGRLPTNQKNDPSATEFGARVADALAEIINQKIMVGPLNAEDIPWNDISVSPILVRIKPNGKARIIINLSAPHNTEGPGSVNSTIDSSLYEARMSSTANVAGMILRAGPGAKIGKADWNSAYKHIAVAEEDLRLQFVKWGGKYFCELKLVFGAKSSPGIFDDIGKILLWCALKRVHFKSWMASQHVDDVILVGLGDKDDAERAYYSYKSMAKDWGISLAGKEDKDKAFKPETGPVICLGLMYETISFTWWIRDDKLLTILHMIESLQATSCP
jgi:hypothetical protein